MTRIDTGDDPRRVLGPEPVEGNSHYRTVSRIGRRFGSHLALSAPQRQFVADLRSFQGVMLALCLVLRGAPVSVAPSDGVDASWVLALNLARQERLQFGRAIQFTYGPWGYLDNPLATSRPNLVSGIVFALFALTVAWLALRANLTKIMRPEFAAIASTAILVLVMPVGGASSVLLLGIVLAVMEYIAHSDTPSCAWLPAFGAACAALLLQIKFSEGAFLTLVVLLSCLFAPRRRLRRSAEAIVVYLIATGTAWYVGGQALGNLPRWFVDCLTLSRAFSDAMATDFQPNVLSYGLLIFTIVVIVSYIVRMAVTQGWRRVTGVSAVTVVVLYLAFREGTGRHDLGHEAYFYLWVIPAIAWFARFHRSRPFRYAMLSLVVLLGYSGVSLSPLSVRARWTQPTEVVASDSYQQYFLTKARASTQPKYNVSWSMRMAIAGHPMAIDGYESTLPWSYNFDWRPAPYFQSYLAYTDADDTTNSNWLQNLPDNELILRPRVTAIDGRNSLWDPPRYVLGEMCTLRVVASDTKWLLLQKTNQNRCGAPSVVSDVRVRKGEAVAVPKVGPSQLLTMSFSADPPSLLVKAGRALNKPFVALQASTESASYRLPRALADGPLIVCVPSEIGWPSAFGGDTSYKNISFNEAGTIRFDVINVA